MPDRLMHAKILAHPLHRTLLLADEDADHVEDDLSTASYESVAAGDGDQIYISSRQSVIPMRVAMSVWSDDPHRTDETWDGQFATTLFCPTGNLVLREITGGVPGAWSLPSTGRYEVQIRWRNRDLAELKAHSGAVIADEDAANGIEEYEIDFWLSPDREEEDNDEL